MTLTGTWKRKYAHCFETMSNLDGAKMFVRKTKDMTLSYKTRRGKTQDSGQSMGRLVDEFMGRLVDELSFLKVLLGYNDLMDHCTLCK